MAITTGLEQFLPRIENPKPFLEAILKDITYTIWLLLRNETFGRMAQEWDYDYRVDQREGTGEVWNGLPHTDPIWEMILYWHNYGTQRHFVAPVTALALHWIDEKTGEDRFSKGHVVKGIKAKHFAEHADKQVRAYEKLLKYKWIAWIEHGTLP